MIIEQAHQEVIVDRGRGPSAGFVTGSLYQDIPNNEARTIEQGPFLALCVRLDGGQDVFALPNQVQVPKADELATVRLTEADAILALLSNRDEMWGGGGRVVYTQG